MADVRKQQDHLFFAKPSLVSCAEYAPPLPANGVADAAEEVVGGLIQADTRPDVNLKVGREFIREATVGVLLGFAALGSIVEEGEPFEIHPPLLRDRVARREPLGDLDEVIVVLEQILHAAASAERQIVCEIPTVNQVKLGL